MKFKVGDKVQHVSLSEQFEVGDKVVLEGPRDYDNCIYTIGALYRNYAELKECGDSLYELSKLRKVNLDSVPQADQQFSINEFLKDYEHSPCCVKHQFIEKRTGRVFHLVSDIEYKHHNPPTTPPKQTKAQGGIEYILVALAYSVTCGSIGAALYHISTLL